MLDHAREAVDMTRGRSRRDLDTDRQLNLALFASWKLSGKRQLGFLRKNGCVFLRSHGRRPRACETG
jgi:hypothetical protein